MTAPVVVTLDVWRVPRRDVAAAMTRVPLLRRGLGRASGATFGKVLGTADRRFTPGGATPTRWAVLATWADGDAAARFRDAASLHWWRAHATEVAALTMRPLRSRGRWDGHAPFGDGDTGERWSGRVVALTRSTLRAGRALRFYGAVPPIAADLSHAKGLRVAFGIGEAPVLRQGTVSLWDDVHDMEAFASATAAHAEAVRATPQVGWYAEELFARFALVDAMGTIDGRSVA